MQLCFSVMLRLVGRSGRPNTETMTSHYGDSCADFYDEIYGPPREDVVRALTKLARGGSVLELGAATGRTALALLGRGLAVTGIESSLGMLQQLRRKSGADGMRVFEGDFATLRLAEQFHLIFALVSTFCLLETQKRQEQCLHNVAAMLKRDGVLVLEMFRPGGGEHEITAEGRRSHVRTELVTRTGQRIYEARLLYPEVEVLDSMATNAGLVLKERFGDWKGSSYAPHTGNHVSVYGRT